MNLHAVSERYRDEMTASFGTLADMVRRGEMTPSEFMEAQGRIYEAYRIASLRLALVQID